MLSYSGVGVTYLVKTLYYLLTAGPGPGLTELLNSKSSNFSDLWLFPFATCVNDTSGAPLPANISANFRKNLKLPSWAWEKLIHGKKPAWSRKSRDTVPSNWMLNSRFHLLNLRAIGALKLLKVATYRMYLFFSRCPLWLLKAAASTTMIWWFSLRPTRYRTSTQHVNIDLDRQFLFSVSS